MEDQNDNARPWLIKGRRHWTFTKQNVSGGANTFGADGETAAHAFAAVGMPESQFEEWEWYEIDDKGQPVMGFDAQGYPIKSRGN